MSFDEIAILLNDIYKNIKKEDLPNEREFIKLL